MKIVYIAHKVSGAVHENIARIIGITRHLNLTEPDVVPFVPYLPDLLALDDAKPEERERGIRNGNAILRSGIVNEVWVCSDYEHSKGVQAEIALALEMGIPVKHYKFYY